VQGVDAQDYINSERDSWEKLTTAISGKLVAFDTAPLIYYIEEHPEYSVYS